MHKGYGRRTGPIWFVVAIMTVVIVIIARAGFKSFQSAEDLYKANEVYYVNDKGSSVAIKVMDIDPEPLVLNGHKYYLVKHERGVAVFIESCGKCRECTRSVESLFECACNTREK